MKYMKIVSERQYRDETSLKPQSWHETLHEVQNFFNERMHQDITTESGFEAVMGNENTFDQYNDMVSSLCGTDDRTRGVMQSIIRHSAEDVKNPFAVPNRMSTEASDGLANNANYSSLAKLNSWVVIGYTARSKCMELFHTFSSDDPTMSFKYNIDYLVKGSENKKYIRPNADRDGDLSALYENPLLEPNGKVDPVNHLNEHLIQPVEYVGASSGSLELMKNGSTPFTNKDYDTLNSESHRWIKIAGGISGNLFNEQKSDGYARSKFTLEKNPMITGILYTDGTKDNGKLVLKRMKVWFERKEGTGEQSIKEFREVLNIRAADSAGAADKGPIEQITIMGFINLDDASYTLTAIDSKSIKVIGVQLDVRLTNVSNELGTIRAGSTQIIESFSVDNHPYATVPVIPELSDDFNIGGSGVSAMAYYTDKVVSGLASMRDQTFEKKLDEAYEKPPEQHPLYVKLGGFKGHVAFPLAARLAGGGDPYSWMTIGLKNTIISHLAHADMITYFEDEIPRQWYILGSEIDINRIPNVTYTEYDGSNGVGDKHERQGFAIGHRAGFIDSMNRSVRVIGSNYRRHYQNKQGVRIPMRAVLKTMSLEQPTTLYLPYSFRIYSGIMNEYAHRTGLIVSARDCIRVMSGVQSRIQLLNNDDGLYGAICKNSGGGGGGGTPIGDYFTLTGEPGAPKNWSTAVPPATKPAFPSGTKEQRKNGIPTSNQNIWEKNKDPDEPPEGSIH